MKQTLKVRQNKSRQAQYPMIRTDSLGCKNRRTGRVAHGCTEKSSKDKPSRRLREWHKPRPAQDGDVPERRADLTSRNLWAREVGDKNHKDKGSNECPQCRHLKEDMTKARCSRDLKGLSNTDVCQHLESGTPGGKVPGAGGTNGLEMHKTPTTK